LTKRVALLGKPLRRRHSVVMHNAAFAAAGIDGRYELMEIDEVDVPVFVALARGEDFLGLGVTAPYKPLVASLVDEVEADANEIGAVNNVLRTDEGAPAPSWPWDARSRAREWSWPAPAASVARSSTNFRRPVSRR
jgi:shikimate 5-dehydrogenase